MLVLALEASTSSAKVMLYESEKGTLDSIEQKYSNKIDDGSGKTNPEGVASLLFQLGYQIAAGKPIDSIAICSTWHSLIVCDSSLKPITPTYSWNFLGASNICQEMRSDSELTDILYQRTGCMVHVIYPRHTLQYLRNNGLDYSDKLFLSQGAYIYHCLTGEFAESISTQSGSGLLNISSLTYDDFAMEYFRVDPGQFGKLVTYENLGHLNSKGAKLLGLSTGIPVVAAHPDGALNQIGSGANLKGKMTVSIGTSGALRMTTDKPILPKGKQLWCYYGVNSTISGAAISGAGNCINWFMNTWGHNKTYQNLEENETKQELPIFLPFLYGERCPGWNDDRKASFFNVNPTNTVKDLYKSVQMGILFNLFQCYKIICSEYQAPGEIILSGGIINSPIWTQMFVDIFRVSTKISPNPQASLIGAVVLALHACGAIDDINQFKPENLINSEPNEKLWDYYQGYYSRYLECYES